MDRSAAFPDGRVNDGWSAFLKFITGYVVEESLSVDNVFVIAMLFQYFAVPRHYQHRVLFWGILGAVAMRGLMIAIGAQLVAQFSWILYVFGGILIADRDQDGVLHRGGDGSRPELHRPGRAADVSRHRPLSRRALLRERGHKAGC